MSSATPIISETYTTQGFWRFIALRQIALIRKVAGVGVLTADPIIRTEKFCNIDREDDKSTIDLRRVVWNNQSIPLKDKFLYSMIFRFCVSSSTILDIIEQNPNVSPTVLVEQMTSPEFRFKWRKSVPYHLPLISKSLRTKDGVCADNLKWIITKIHAHHDAFWDELTSDTNQSHEELTTRLTNYSKPYLSKGFKFYIAQALLDLMYHSEYIDPAKHVHLGIGCLKGIKRIVERMHLEQPMSPFEYIEHLNANVSARVSTLFPRGINPAVLEHGLCEYTKYCEYLDGTRERKYLYSPKVK